MFAHASLRLTADSAAECVQEIRNRIRSPATEYKATHLLRARHRPVLEWMLGPSGPIHGNAHVHLTDKTFFVVGRVVDLLLGEVGYGTGVGLGRDRQAEAVAATLYREGQRRFGREQWRAFLESSNSLMRTRRPWRPTTAVDAFLRVVDVLRLAATPGGFDEVTELLRQAGPRADAFRAQLLDNPRMIPALDPLLPAIVRAVAYWSADGSPVSIVHDEQSALTAERIGQLQEILSRPTPALIGYAPRGRLISVRFVDSRSDPRVQVADFLAGVARRIASDELNDRGDAELTGLLRPYLDSFSIWGDERSWSLLGPGSSVQSAGSDVGSSRPARS